MTKKFSMLMLLVFLFSCVSGCSVITSGSASWEIYGGVRSTKTSDEEAKVELESSVVTKIVELFTEQDKTEAQ